MDLIDIARYVGALILVLGLLGLAGLAARRFGVPGLVKPGAERRLAIVESLMIAPRTKLLLIRRDGIEHLVMLTPQGATPIEGCIEGAAPRMTDYSAQP
jgi:flagellar protein FliO/FliZ